MKSTQYVSTKKAMAVILKSYPGSHGHRVRQISHSGENGWHDLSGEPGGGYSIKELPRLYDQKYKTVQIRLIDQYGAERFLDYQLEEFMDVFYSWEPGDSFTVHVNQGEREARVLGVDGDEAIIEYEMPKGTTALRLINRHDPTAHPGPNIHYRRCPARWLKAIVAAGKGWKGQSQQGQRYVPDPEDMLRQRGVKLSDNPLPLEV